MQAQAEYLLAQLHVNNDGGVFLGACFATTAKTNKTAKTNELLKKHNETGTNKI